MKKILIVISFILSSTVSYSQFIPVPSWGVKGGFNFADIGGEEADNAMKTSLNVGVYGQKHFNAFWNLRIELLFSGQGHGAKTDLDNKLNLLCLNLPVMVEYAPAFNWGLHAGFQPGLILSAKAKFEGSSIDVKEQFNTIDMALVAGGSYYLMDKKLGITVRYNHGFTSLSKSTDLVPDPQSRYNRVIQIAVSYMIARLFEE